MKSAATHNTHGCRQCGKCQGGGSGEALIRPPGKTWKEGPAPAQSTGWISTQFKPAPHTPVLVLSAGQVLRAQWVPRFSREDTGNYSSEDAEYKPENDTYYWPEGWYEWNHFDECHWRLEGADRPSMWHPMPQLPGGMFG